MRRSSRLVMVVVLALTSVAPASDNKKLREEEINWQREGGYTLVHFSFGSVYVADLTKQDRWTKEEQLPPPHDRVQDGLLSPRWRTDRPGTDPAHAPNSLGIFHRDGSGLQEYMGFSRAVCWSPGGELLVVEKERSLHPGFVLLNIRLGTVTELNLPSRAKVTRQCWSPDGQKLIYYKMDHDPLWWTNPKVKKEPPNWGTLYIYDIAQNSSRDLGGGQYPTWAPDGEWIAYWDSGGYYRIHPSGEDRQLLFKYREQSYQGPLLWSPDSRTLLYYDCCTLMASLRCMCDVGRWLVRRPGDDARIEVSESSPFEAVVWIRQRNFQAH